MRRFRRGVHCAASSGAGVVRGGFRWLTPPATFHRPSWASCRLRRRRGRERSPSVPGWRSLTGCLQLLPGGARGSRAVSRRPAEDPAKTSHGIHTYAKGQPLLCPRRAAEGGTRAACSTHTRRRTHFRATLPFPSVPKLRFGHEAIPERPPHQNGMAFLSQAVFSSWVEHAVVVCRVFGGPPKTLQKPLHARTLSQKDKPFLAPGEPSRAARHASRVLHPYPTAGRNFAARGPSHCLSQSGIRNPVSKSHFSQ